MKYLYLLLALFLGACSESPTYRVFTMNSSGDYLETVLLTQDKTQAEALFTVKYREREDCSENCEEMYQQLYMAVEPCNTSYGLTVCHEISYSHKW